MLEMRHTRRSSSRRAQRGRGYATSQQYFDPAVRPPTAFPFVAAASTAPTPYEIRPALYSTFQSGAGRRKTRRVPRAGFSPSVMGGFIPNAQAAIVPAVLYGAYHYLVPKKSTRKSSRKSGGRRAAARRGGY